MQSLTVEQFKQALLGAKPNKAELAMLEANFRAPGHAISVRQLAEVAGYAFGAVNIHYGKYGRKLAEYHNLSSPMRNEKDDPVWTGVLATGNDDDPDAANYVWTMRPELVEALQQLRWFR